MAANFDPTMSYQLVTQMGGPNYYVQNGLFYAIGGGQPISTPPVPPIDTTFSGPGNQPPAAEAQIGS